MVHAQMQLKEKRSSYSSQNRSRNLQITQAAAKGEIYDLQEKCCKISAVRLLSKRFPKIGLLRFYSHSTDLSPNGALRSIAISKKPTKAAITVSFGVIYAKM